MVLGSEEDIQSRRSRPEETDMHKLISISFMEVPATTWLGPAFNDKQTMEQSKILPDGTTETGRTQNSSWNSL